MKNNCKMFCHVKKRLYLCIAFKENNFRRASEKSEILGRLAQLVQSICLTSRGSAVRIRQRPLKNQALIEISVSAFSFWNMQFTCKCGKYRLVTCDYKSKKLFSQLSHSAYNPVLHLFKLLKMSYTTFNFLLFLFPQSV